LAYIDLDYVQVKENEAKMKFMILSALPRDVDFYVLKKDKHVKASAKDFVVLALFNHPPLETLLIGVLGASGNGSSSETMGRGGASERVLREAGRA